MKNIKLYIGIVSCIVFFCAAPVFGQNIDTCKRWLGWIGIKTTSQGESRMKYDTLHHYIVSCGKNADSYDAFSGLDAAVELMSDDPMRYDVYRAWLISVLYINTTQPYYFCACMNSIAGTYTYTKYHPLATLAILKYIESNDCSGEGMRDQIISDSSIDFQEGYDPTHLPTMHDLGLDSILRLHSSSPSPTTYLLNYLTSFTSSPNPFINETTLKFTLNRMTYTTIAVYDELGRLLWGDGRGSSLEAGMHQIHLDGKGLPSGTLYARISTGFGEVKTVKLIHK